MTKHAVAANWVMTGMSDKRVSEMTDDEIRAMAGASGPSIDQDDSATWRQLRDRLREVRAWAEGRATIEPYRVRELLDILDRPRERG